MEEAGETDGGLGGGGLLRGGNPRAEGASGAAAAAVASAAKAAHVDHQGVGAALGSHHVSWAWTTRTRAGTARRELDADGLRRGIAAALPPSAVGAAGRTPGAAPRRGGASSDTSARLGGRPLTRGAMMLAAGALAKATAAQPSRVVSPPGGGEAAGGSAKPGAPDESAAEAGARSALRKEIKAWERDFRARTGRSPTRADVGTGDLREKYKRYERLKRHAERQGDLPNSSPRSVGAFVSSSSCAVSGEDTSTGVPDASASASASARSARKRVRIA